MTATERTDDLGRLRALLHAPPADVADAVRQLADERRRVSDGALGVELLDREQRWLQRFRTTGTRALQDDLASVRREWLASRARRRFESGRYRRQR